MLALTCAELVHVGGQAAMDWRVRCLYFQVVLSLFEKIEKATGFKLHLGDTRSHTGSEVTYPLAYNKK